MNKNQQYWQAHIIDYAARSMGKTPGGIVRTAAAIARVGGISSIEAIKVFAEPKNHQQLREIMEDLEIREDEPEPDNKAVDEGGIASHDYDSITISPEPDQLAGVNAYTPFSVPIGLSN